MIFYHNLISLSEQKANTNFHSFFKVACKVQYGKKHFVKIVTSLVTDLLKMTLGLCIYFEFTKKPFKI